MSKRSRSRHAPAARDEPSSSLSRGAAWRRLLPTLAIFLLALAVRALHLWHMSSALLYQTLISDGRRYDQWAQSVAAGDWLGDEVFYQTPLYPYLLASIYVLVGHSLWAVRIVQALLGAWACVLIARATARFLNERAGLCAGIMLAVYPPAIFFDSIVQKAAVDLVLMSAVVWCLALAADARRAGWFFAIGAALGATTLNRENAALLIPIVGCWIAWLSWPRRPRATAAWLAAFAGGVALILVPVGARNHYVGGTFTLTTSQMGPNFYIGNGANATGTYDALRADRGDAQFEQDDARLLAEQDTGRQLTPGEVSRYWLARALREIAADPARWLRLLGRKWLLTWNRLELADSESIYTYARYSPLLSALLPFWNMGVLVPLAAAGVWYTRRDWRRLWVLYALLVAMAAAVTLFYVFARYRYPLVPPLMLFAAAGALGTWDRLRRPSPADLRDLFVAGAIALVVVVCCNLPGWNSADDEAVTFYNAALSLRDDGRPDDARALCVLALEVDPGHVGANNLLGRMALDERRFADAQRYFQRALAADPRNGRLLFGLAEALAESGDEASAVDYVLRAVRANQDFLPSLANLARDEQARARPRAAVAALRAWTLAEPGNANAHFMLADALTFLDRRREAIPALRHALKIDPSSAVVQDKLAWLLATADDDALRDGEESVILAQAACTATGHQQPAYLATLAAAFAECGRFPEALEACDRAIALARDARQLESWQAHKKAYQSGRPVREGPPAAGDRPASTP